MTTSHVDLVAYRQGTSPESIDDANIPIRTRAFDSTVYTANGNHFQTAVERLTKQPTTANNVSPSTEAVHVRAAHDRVIPNADDDDKSTGMSLRNKHEDSEHNNRLECVDDSNFYNLFPSSPLYLGILEKLKN